MHKPFNEHTYTAHVTKNKYLKQFINTLLVLKRKEHELVKRLLQLANQYGNSPSILPDYVAINLNKEIIELLPEGLISKEKEMKAVMRVI